MRGRKQKITLFEHCQKEIYIYIYIQGNGTIDSYKCSPAPRAELLPLVKWANKRLK
jgi:hypothetical protein